jgi:hypothetical protein
MPSSSLNKRLVVILIVVVLLVFLPARRMAVWKMNLDVLEQVDDSPLILKAALVKPPDQADLNGDGKKECIVLNEGNARITNCGKQTFWQSPSSWQVTEAQMSDLNQDGQPEVTLFVWRPFQPWPIDREDPNDSRIKNFHNRKNQSCHVILIHWAGAGYQELWAGSALVRPVSQLHTADVNGDGVQELVALEGYYDSPFNGGTLTIWRWRGFGFTLVDQSEASYRSLEIRQVSDVNWIVTQ